MAKKRLASPEHADTLSLKALRELVTGLVDEVRQLSAEVTTLRAENAALREDNATLRLENTRLKVDNQLLRDEIARLKNLPPRPPFRPSGMDKATDDKRDARQATSKKPRGPKLDLKRISREEVLHLDVPPGSRFKGYKSCHVRELIVTAELVHYRRECWILPNGKAVLAPLPQGVVGGYGPNLRRFCLMLHAQGQVTMARLTTLLNDVGVSVSKRQVVRLLTGDSTALLPRMRRCCMPALSRPPTSPSTIPALGMRAKTATPPRSGLSISPSSALPPQSPGSAPPSTIWTAVAPIRHLRPNSAAMNRDAFATRYRISGRQGYRHFRQASGPRARGSRHLGIHSPSRSSR